MFLGYVSVDNHSFSNWSVVLFLNKDKYSLKYIDCKELIFTGRGGGSYVTYKHIL